MFTSAKESYAVTSKTSSLVGTDTISVFGNDGTIGGKKVDFTGQTYMGHLGQNHLRVVQLSMVHSTVRLQKQCLVDSHGLAEKVKICKKCRRHKLRNVAKTAGSAPSF